MNSTMSSPPWSENRPKMASKWSQNASGTLPRATQAAILGHTWQGRGGTDEILTTFKENGSQDGGQNLHKINKKVIQNLKVFFQVFITTLERFWIRNGPKIHPKMDPKVDEN